MELSWRGILGLKLKGEEGVETVKKRGVRKRQTKDRKEWRKISQKKKKKVEEYKRARKTKRIRGSRMSRAVASLQQKREREDELFFRGTERNVGGQKCVTLFFFLIVQKLNRERRFYDVKGVPCQLGHQFSIVTILCATHTCKLVNI